MLFNNPPKPRHYYVLPALVLLLLALYSYARFFTVPYVGFQINGSDGLVVDLFVESDDLQPGDFVLQVNDIPHAVYDTNLRVGWLLDFQAGEHIELTVERDGEARQIDWVVPGFNLPEFWTRLLNTWWVSYAFWLAGTVILLLVRPEDLRWGLLIAFNYITAIWFITGAVSTTAVYYSPLVFRSAVWLSLPIYLHLHWTFPHPWPRLPKWFWPILYVICAAFGALQWTDLIPGWLYTLPLLAGVLGSLLILLVRLRKPEDRREVVVLLTATAIALIPSTMAALVTSRGNSDALLAGSVISLVALPGAYLYVVSRRQLGGLELRANRLISLYLFFVILFTLSLVALPLLSPLLQNPSEVAAAILFTGILVSLFSVFGFERFQRFVERWLLRIPLPPERLAQDFASRISTSFVLEHLVDILQSEVLSSLLIRQSALVLTQPQPGAVAYRQAVSEAELPSESEMAALLHTTAETTAPSALPATPSWVRLPILIQAGGAPQAIWLLGRKDPDDYYSYAERQTLTSLADQMGIALINIAQKNSLRLLHQHDIDRQESEQAHLARDLHDDVLQEVNSLFRAISQKGSSEGFSEQLHALNDRVRQLIHGLRPAMLDFGLYRALAELVDDLAAQLGDQISVSLMVTENTTEYDKRVTEHVYRIVQQAARNAIKHSRGQNVSISGDLKPRLIDLEIEDDGVGFEHAGADLSQLLIGRHYGLASMSERAALIGAQLNVDTAPGKGTRVHLYWKS